VQTVNALNSRYEHMSRNLYILGRQSPQTDPLDYLRAEQRRRKLLWVGLVLACAASMGLGWVLGQ